MYQSTASFIPARTSCVGCVAQQRCGLADVGQRVAHVAGAELLRRPAAGTDRPGRSSRRASRQQPVQLFSVVRSPTATL